MTETGVVVRLRSVFSALLRRPLPGGALALVCCILACSAVLPAAAFAQGGRFITLIVASAPGGPADAAARIIAGPMSAKLGQQIVVENVPGGGGMIGAARVARAEPDGHTLLIHQTGLTIAPALTPKLGFDVARDLAPVGLVNTSYSVLIGRPSLEAADFRALVAWMKAPDRSTRVAHPGNGTLGHLASVLTGKALGVRIDLVPYRGIGPAMNDIIGGHVDLLWAAPISAAPLVKAGTVKAYAFGAGKRTPLLPDVPSIAELGYPELDIPFWHALYAPGGTPPETVQKLNDALRAALADPAVQKAYADSGTEAFPPDQLSVEAARAFVARELKKWAQVVRENGVAAEN